MADTGFTRLNDIVFTVPPDQIHIAKKSYNNFWQTLRTKSSQKLPSGFAEIQISMVIFLVENDLLKLRNLVSQVRVTPFVHVENQFLRNTILGGQGDTQMVLALQQLEIQKAGDSTDVIQLSLNFVWFNYLPYMKEWKYRADLFSPQSVKDPKYSKAFKLLYWAEQDRQIGGKEAYPVIATLTNKIELSLTEFALVDKKHYMKVEEDVAKLTVLLKQLKMAASGQSEFPGIDGELAFELRDQAKKQGFSFETNDLSNGSSMGPEEGGNDTLVKVATGLLNAREKELGYLDDIMSQSGYWSPVVLQSETGYPTVIESHLGIEAQEEMGPQPPQAGTTQVLMKRFVPIDLVNIGFIPVAISITFDNNLARIPLLGHTYPTYQHIGSIDGVVTISLMTTNEEAVKSISRFYSTYESMRRKFRQVPAGLRNISVDNGLINTCGLREFIFENIVTDTVKGQPGTYSVILTLVDNPVTSETQEQLIPGQSITTKADVHRLLFKVLMDKFIKFDDSMVVRENGRVSIPRHSDTALSLNSFSAIVSAGASFGGPLGAIAGLGAAAAAAAATTTTTSATVYKYVGNSDERHRVLQEVSTQLAAKMSMTLSELWDVLNSTSGSRKTRFGGLASFFLLNNQDVIGVDIFQNDTYKIFLPTKQYQKDIEILRGTDLGNAQPESSSWATADETGLGVAGELSRGFGTGIDDTTLLALANDTPQILDIYAEITSSIAAERTMALRQSQQTLKEAHNALIFDFFQATLADWNEWINNFLLQLLRSSVIQLNEFKEVREALNSIGISPGSNGYPDFPMNELAAIIQAEYPNLNDTLVNTAASKQLGLKNVSAAALINPDFYLYNPSEIGESPIDSLAIKTAKAAILVSQGDERLKAETAWIQSVYEKRLLSPATVERIHQDVMTRTYGDDETRDIMNKEHEALSKGDNSEIENDLTQAAQKSKGIIVPDDYEGQKIPCCIAARKGGSSKEDKVSPPTKTPEKLAQEENKETGYFNAAGTWVKEIVESGLEKVQSLINSGTSVIQSAISTVDQGNLGSESLGPILWGEIDKKDDGYNIINTERKQIEPNPPAGAGICKHRMSVVDAVGELSPIDCQDKEIIKAADMPVWIWPVNILPPTTEIKSKFREIRPDINSSGEKHNGIDIGHILGGESSEKLEVRAAADGDIVYITPEHRTSDKTYREGDPRFGRGPSTTVGTIIGKKKIDDIVEIRIKHTGGWHTVYKHMQWEPHIQNLSLTFNGGKDTGTGTMGPQPLEVKQGDLLGYVGNTGYSTGPHLHFEIRKNASSSSTVDPELALAGLLAKSLGPVTLIDPSNESLLSRSIQQFEKELLTGQGYSLMRAYPTFKLYFIESDLGERKKLAFDDFFSYSQVVDIQMVRSSKIPADLVMITLTNVSGVLTNRKFRGDANEENPRDSQGHIAKEDPLKESNIASLMLQPGTQIQLRLGFSNNPSELETVFNGVITDVQLSGAEDIAQITCQSFAIELVQNIHGNVRKYGNNTFLGYVIPSTSGRTSDMLESLMASPEVAHFGRWEPGESSIGKTIRRVLTDRWTVTPQPQDDNIFAPTGTRGITGLLDGSSPYVMYNTTIWDVFKEMTLRHPGFIASAVPYEGEWGPRMTMFFGVPDQFYFSRDPNPEEVGNVDELKNSAQEFVDDAAKVKAETEDPSKEPSDDTKNKVAQATEKINRKELAENSEELRKIWADRIISTFAKDKGLIKPFRSYHLASSALNIIDNRITSTSWNTFNSVTLQYEDDGAKVSEETGQIEFDDAETFTLMCDASIPDHEKRELFAQYPNCVDWEVAKRYCISLLKESLKEGYRGTLTIMGNPKIKPYDIVYITDEYNDMYGPIEVEQVVHKFSQQDGFITEITPAMCIHINETVTMATQDAMGLITESAMRGLGITSSPDAGEGIKGDEATAVLATAAIHAGDILAGIAAPLGGPAFSLMSMAVSAFDSTDTTAGNPRNYQGLVGTFIFRKLISRSQLAHLFHYSPLVLQGKPMIGGVPTKHNDGGWIQGIGRWFKEAHKSAPLYLDSLYDRISPNNWINPQGDFKTFLTGSKKLGESS